MWRRRRRRVSRHDGDQQLTTTASTVVQRANDICSTRTETPDGRLACSPCRPVFIARPTVVLYLCVSQTPKQLRARQTETPAVGDLAAVRNRLRLRTEDCVLRCLQQVRTVAR